MFARWLVMFPLLRCNNSHIWLTVLSCSIKRQMFNSDGDKLGYILLIVSSLLFSFFWYAARAVKRFSLDCNTIATDISTTTPMLNRPQELTAWKVSETATKSKLEADNAKQCYLEIACKIRQSGAYLLGSASEYKTIYVPFGDTWVAGKRHIYTLIFGGGYNDQGEAVLNPIQFDAETTDWGNADKADKDVNV